MAFGVASTGKMSAFRIGQIQTDVQPLLTPDLPQIVPTVSLPPPLS